MIKNVEIKNFRNLKNVSYDLSEKNIFKGVNDIGKTNTINAIYWLLSGELICDDISKSKQVDTIIDVNNQRDTVEVKITLEDGTELSKKYYQRWTRTRGTTEEKYEGNTTESYLNGSLVKESDWIRTVFKCFDSEFECKTKAVNPISALIDPNYLLNKLDAKDLRKFISELVGEITNEEVAKKNQSYAKLLDLFKNTTPEQVRTNYTTKCNSYNKQIDSKKGEINAYANDYDNNKEEELKGQIKGLEDKLGLYVSNPDIDKLTAEKTQSFNKIVSMQTELMSLCEKHSKSVCEDMKMNIDQNVIDKSREIESVVKDVEKIKNNGVLKRMDYVKNKETIARYETNVKEYEKYIQEKQELIGKLYAEEFKEVRCPKCDELINKAELETFSEKREMEIGSLKNKIKVNEEQIQKVKSTIKGLEETNTKLYAEMNVLSTQIKEKQVIYERLNLELEEIKKAPKEEYISPDTVAYKQRISDIEKDIKEAKLKDDELGQKLRELKYNDLLNQQQYQNEIKAELSPLRELLTDVLVAKREVEKKAVAEEELKAIYKAQAEDESILILVDTFIKDKIKMLNEKTSLYFDGIEFVMLEDQKNGGIKEVCYPIYKGVKYDAVNTGNRELIGLSVINSIKHNMNIGDLPILFDKAESLDNRNINKIDCNQLIATQVDQSEEITLIN